MHHRNLLPKLLLGLFLLLFLTAPMASPPVTAAGLMDVAARPAAAALVFAAPATAPTLGYVGGLGSVVETAAISGSLAFVGEYHSLAILDISVPARPIVLARMPLSGEILGLQVVGSLVYIANGSYGLQIVDVSDPIRPALHGSLALEGNPSDIAVVEGRAYIPAYGNGLKIIDVTNPASPTLLGTSTYSTGGMTGVKVVGDRAYVAGLAGLSIYDVSNPTAPAFLGRFDTVGNGGGYGYDLDVVGSLVYLADGGLEIIDVSNPTSPSRRGHFALPLYSLAVQVSDNLAYIAGQEGGLVIVDVANPAAPIRHGSFDTPGSAYDVQVVGDLAYVSDYNGGLQILDVTNPASPTGRGSYITIGNTRKSWAQNKLVYIAAGTDGLRIVDMSTPGRPRILSSMSLPGQIIYVQVVGDLAYVCDWENGKLFLVDVGDPTRPTLISTYATSHRATAVKVIGALAYISAGGGGLEIVDVSDRTAPTLRGKFGTDSFARDIDVLDNLAYIANEAGDLQIIDVSEPTSPTLRGKFQTQRVLINSVHAVGGHAYVTYTTYQIPFPGPQITGSGLQIIDVSDPVSPTLRGMFNAGIQANDVQVVENRAYIAVDKQLLMVDVSDPTNLQLLDSFKIEGPAEGMHVSDGLIYVTGRLAGLQVLSDAPGLLPSAATITADGGQVASIDGSIRIDFPAGAVAETIVVTYTGLMTPTQPLSDGRSLVRSFRLEARTANGQPVTQFDKPFTMVIGYTDAQLADLGVWEDSLEVALWNSEVWADLLPCAGCGVDAANNRVTVAFDRIGEFALVGDHERQVFMPLVSR